MFLWSYCSGHLRSELLLERLLVTKPIAGGQILHSWSTSFPCKAEWNAIQCCDGARTPLVNAAKGWHIWWSFHGNVGKCPVYADVNVQELARYDSLHSVKQFRATVDLVSPLWIFKHLFGVHKSTPHTPGGSSWFTLSLQNKIHNRLKSFSHRADIQQHCLLILKQIDSRKMCNKEESCSKMGLGYTFSYTHSTERVF